MNSVAACYHYCLKQGRKGHHCSPYQHHYQRSFAIFNPNPCPHRYRNRLNPARMMMLVQQRQQQQQQRLYQMLCSRKGGVDIAVATDEVQSVRNGKTKAFVFAWTLRNMILSLSMKRGRKLRLNNRQLHFLLIKRMGSRKLGEWYSRYLKFTSMQDNQYVHFFASTIMLMIATTSLVGSQESWLEQEAKGHGDEDSAVKTKESDFFVQVSNGSMEDFLKRYELGKLLGVGTFAVVWLGVNQETNERVAVKEIRKDISDEDLLEKEVKIMQMLGKHPNIKTLLEVYDSPDTLFLVMDLAEGGELFHKIVTDGELSEFDASKLFRDAVMALQHLHEKHIVHLDIKPENLLLDSEGTLKLADFGCAQVMDGEHKMMTVGTPAYWAPEMVKNDTFTQAVDVWALGCVLYIILCGSHPFDPNGDAPEAHILEQVSQGKYDTKNGHYIQISRLAKNLIAHMLDPNPRTRFTTDQILSHPWLSEAQDTKPLQHMRKLTNFVTKRSKA